MASLSWADTIYVYRAPDGSTLITDQPKSAGHRLLRTYYSDFGSGSVSYGDSLVRQSRFDPLIERTARRYGVDTALVKAVVHAESSFNPHAVSHKGATGLMQLMPETASRYGVADRFDPEQNVRGGVHYLRDLLAMFGNDTRLAVAAYNAGEGAVQRFSGVPPYGETQTYVQRVLDLHRRYSGS